jgi:hypothetical protein
MPSSEPPLSTAWSQITRWSGRDLVFQTTGTLRGFHEIPVAVYLKTRGLPSGSLTERVNADKAAQPARLASFLIDVIVPGLDDHQQAPVLRGPRAPA